jgi:hypothetical protein
MNLPADRKGLLYNDDGVLKFIIITDEQFKRVVCHTMQPHGVSSEGGFYGGINSSAGKGAAIGRNAKTLDASLSPVDCIQLGEGNNHLPRTLKFYDTWVILENGLINPELLPGFGFRDLKIISENEIVNIGIESYLIEAHSDNVNLILPNIDKVQKAPFTFRFINNSDGFGMTVETSDLSKIVWNDEEWDGITTDVIGTWFTIIAKDNKFYIISDSGLTSSNSL